MATAVPGTEETLRAIRKLDEEFMKNVAAGDSERLVESFYTEDAQVLPPNRPPVCGLFEIAAFWRAALAAGIKTLQLDTTQVECSGDLAVGLGNYTMRMEPPAGAPVTDAGKYLVAYRRQPDGAWKAVADMFSSNG